MLITPRDYAQRGSQVSFRFDDGYRLVQALMERGVMTDFRHPNIIRLAITPLYTSCTDIDRALVILADILASGIYLEERYVAVKAVT